MGLERRRSLADSTIEALKHKVADGPSSRIHKKTFCSLQSSPNLYVLAHNSQELYERPLRNQAGGYNLRSETGAQLTSLIAMTARAGRVEDAWDTQHNPCYSVLSR